MPVPSMRKPDRTLLRASCALAVLLALLAFVRPARADLHADAFDARIAAELEAEDHEAATLFAAANQARDRKDYAAASDLYERVRLRVPSFYHATRRRCGVELLAGHRDQGLALCREAVLAKETAENDSALAAALLSPPRGSSDMTEARRYVDRSLGLGPREPSVLATAGQYALQQGDFDLLQKVSTSLDEVAPDDTSTFVFRAFVKLAAGERDDAMTALEGARAHGLPDADYAQLKELFVNAPTSLGYKARKVSVWVTLWAGLFGLLALLGYALSRFMLHVVSGQARSRGGSPPSVTTGHPRGVEAALRRVYRSVLWLCCAYYYLSIPIVVLAVVLVGAGVIYGMLAAGYVVIKLVAIVGVLVLGTIIGIAKALFTRTKDVDPGEALVVKDHPRFEELLAEVAGEIGTRPVDKVFLTPWTDVAVFDRGGVMKQMRGQGARCLVLGVGVLDGMNVRALKSVLAHEYGHFRNEDTAGGSFALSVRRSLLLFAVHLARSGVASWYNPAWWFVKGYWKLFLVISQGASRLQEVLADRWAALAYGSEDFVEGLSHVIHQTVRFDAHVKATLNEVVPKRLPLANLYAYAPAVPPAVEDVGKEAEQALARLPSPYDSHPCPADRIAWARALACEGRPRVPADLEPAWGLFEDRQAIEAKMTSEVRERVRATNGVELSA